MYQTTEYGSVLSSRMLGFMKNGEFCDTVIRVDEISFPCHKVVLAASSPVLQAILKGRRMVNSIDTLVVRMDFLTASGAYQLLLCLWYCIWASLTTSSIDLTNFSHDVFDCHSVKV